MTGDEKGISGTRVEGVTSYSAWGSMGWLQTKRYEAGEK